MVSKPVVYDPMFLRLKELQTKNASEKGDWLRAGIGVKLSENVTSGCLSPFSRTIADSVGPSKKGDRHQAANTFFQVESEPRRSWSQSPFLDSFSV